VDHPSDVIWVTEEDRQLLEGTGWCPAPLPAGKGGASTATAAAEGSTAEGLKQQGNTLYLGGSLVDALHVYIKALGLVRDMRKDNSVREDQVASDELCKLEIDLLNNCAAAGVGLKITEGAALAAAYAGKAARLAAASGDSRRAQKALLREGKALYAMQRYVASATARSM
jgi:hypothetical protein